MLLQPQQLQLHRLGDELERELGGASQAGVPAGARTEGLLFERALAGTWRDFLEMHAPVLGDPKSAYRAQQCFDRC